MAASTAITTVVRELSLIFAQARNRIVHLKNLSQASCHGSLAVSPYSPKSACHLTELHALPFDPATTPRGYYHSNGLSIALLQLQQ